MGENEKIKSNLQVVMRRSIKDWRERFLYLLAPGVIFFVFLCICARSEMSFEIFGFLMEDFLKFRGPPKRLRIIIFYFYSLRFSDF